MKKSVLILSVCMVLSLLFSGCGTKHSGDNLFVGYWESESISNPFEAGGESYYGGLSLMFLENGKYVIAEEYSTGVYWQGYDGTRVGEWCTDNHSVLVLEPHETDEIGSVFKYSFTDKNTLVIYDIYDADVTCVLTRKSEPFDKIPN